MTKICLRTCQNILLVTLEIIKCRMHVQNCIFEICQTPNTSLFTLFTFGRITAHYNSCVTFMNTMLKNFRRLLAAVGFGVVSGGGVEEGEEMVMMGSGGEGSVMAGNLATSHNTSHDFHRREESSLETCLRRLPMTRLLMLKMLIWRRRMLRLVFLLRPRRGQLRQ